MRQIFALAALATILPTLSPGQSQPCASPGETLNDVVINQVLASFGSPEKTREVIRRVQEEGTCWCGGTEWKGKTAMRISVSSWATTEADIE